MRSCGIQEKLEGELSKLKSLLNYGAELKVKWLPNQQRLRIQQFSGEVVGETILIYDQDEASALATLRHEYLDFILTTELVNPLVELINLLVKEREREICTQKEKLVKRLSELISLTSERGRG